MIFFIFIICIFKIYFSLYYYHSNIVLEYLNKKKGNESELKEIIKYISETLNDSYAYNEIAKNPPQPYFNNKYYKKVDIQILLNEINTTNLSYYQLYRELYYKISEFKDLHIDIKFGNNINPIWNELYAICPIKFYIKKINGVNKIFCKLNNYQKYYGKNVRYIIDENKNCPIASINNKNPFDFISDFCGNIGKTKNPHGTFTHKFNTHYGYNLGLFPLNFEDLNLEIIYENKIKINLQYFIFSTNKIDDLKEVNFEYNEKININKDNNNLFTNYLKNNKFEKNTKKLSKLEKEFNQLKNIIENKNHKKETIFWDYIFENIFKCRVDITNQINVYYIQSFLSKNYTSYTETFLKCVNLFDKNKYPIVVILNNNDGGYANLPKFMLELISPYISINKYISMKVNDFMKKNKRKFEINDIIKIDYGENITGYLTKPIEDLSWLDEEIINYKKKLKNKRKPTEIIIFTDGYSFSAASTFIKYFQYYGGGIVVGYFGNPKESNIPFDSGQSSSSIFKNETLYLQSPNSYKKLYDKYNISLKMPGNQNFFDDLNLNLPLEYIVTPVDERVDIYTHFKDKYYNLFINEAIQIFNKYKNKCNAKNKKLVFVTNKCDGKFENKYTHGGYICGNNGFWSDKCVPSYCDINYVFNHKIKKCLKRKKNLKIYIISILIILIIINIYLLIKLKYEKNISDDSEEELIDIPEENN